MLLKVIKVKNVLSSTVGVINKGSKFNNLFVMVVIIFDFKS